MKAPRQHQEKATFAARLLRRSVSAPLIVLFLLAAAQTLPSLNAKDVWYPDELRHAAVLRGMLEGGHWLVLHLGDALYPDKPPLYFWLLAGLSRILGSPDPLLFNLAAALSGGVFLWSMIALGRALGLSRRAVLLAGLVLLSNWFFIDRMHQPRMDLLFSAFILLAHLGLFRAASGDEGLRRGWAAFGAGAAMLAVLTKGPVGLLLPVLALVAFLALRGRLRALWSAGAALALAVAAGIGGLYLGGVFIQGGGEAVRALLIDQTVARAGGAIGNRQPFWWYVPQILLAFLPWSLALLALPLRPLLAARAAPLPDGHLWLWTALISGFCALSLIGYKVVHLILPIYGLLALAIALALLRMAAARRRVLFSVIAAMLALAAVAMPLAPSLTAWPEAVRGAWIMAAALAGAALVAAWMRRRGPLAFAAALALAMTVVSAPFYLVTIRALNTVMAPRAVGAVLARHADAGYRLIEYDTDYLGHFHYHSGRWLEGMTSPEAVLTALEQSPCGVLILQHQLLAGLGESADRFEIVMTQQLDTRRYVLARWGEADCPAVSLAP